MHIGEVQADGRLLQQIEMMQAAKAARLEPLLRVHFERARQLRHELDPLRFAAGKRGAALAEREITEAGVAQQGQRTVQARHVGEEIDRLVDGEIEHIGDRFFVVADLERFGIVAAARQVSHGTKVEGRKFISTFTAPWPRQAGQRPEPLLKEKREAS